MENPFTKAIKSYIEDDNVYKIAFPELIQEMVDYNNTPLTKEQLVAEGCMWVGGDSLGRQDYKLNNYFIVYYPSGNEMWIMPIDTSKINFESEIKYTGYCKSINEFRTIMKLLKIEYGNNTRTDDTSTEKVP